MGVTEDAERQARLVWFEQTCSKLHERLSPVVEGKPASYIPELAGVDPDRFRDTVAELEALGVTWLTLGLPGDTRAEFCDAVRRFGDEVLLTLA